MVDLSGGLESDSDVEIPNSKRTPRDRSKRQRMTYDEDDSPGLDQDDTQVPILPNSAALHNFCTSDDWQPWHACNAQLLCQLPSSLTHTGFFPAL